MTDMRRLRWYAVRCDSARHVVKAGVAIARLGVTTFIPMHYREERQGKWLVAVPDGLLFPPYLFITMRTPDPRLEYRDSLWAEISDQDGVDRVMGCRNRSGDMTPLAIPYREMRKIRTMHQASERKKAADRFKPGQKVRITEGPFTGFDGVFDKPENERVRVLLSLFGRETFVELNETDVRAA